eukprot:scaffold15215_cov103-Isochrysis_galbana.AAC.1
MPTIACVRAAASAARNARLKCSSSLLLATASKCRRAPIPAHSCARCRERRAAAVRRASSRAEAPAREACNRHCPCAAASCRQRRRGAAQAEAAARLSRSCAQCRALQRPKQHHRRSRSVTAAAAAPAREQWGCTGGGGSFPPRSSAPMPFPPMGQAVNRGKTASTGGRVNICHPAANAAVLRRGDTGGGGVTGAAASVAAAALPAVAPTCIAHAARAVANEAGPAATSWVG